MMNDFQFGSGRQPVKLIGINAPFQPKLQFGREFQADANDRNSSLQQAGAVNMNARQNHNPGITDPLPIREQTILSQRLSPQLQQKLRSGFSPVVNFGRNNQFPRIDLISVGASVNRQVSESHVMPVPSVNGNMVLRMVKAGF